MAGRAVGKETASSFAVNELGRGLRERTKWAVDKALKFSGEEGKKRLEAVAQEHAVSSFVTPFTNVTLMNIQNKLLAEPRAFSGLFNRSVPASETGKRKIRAGERLTGMSTSATGLGLAKGALGKKSPAKIPGFWQRGWQQKVGLPTPPA
jgi:hypothetical protein